MQQTSLAQPPHVQEPEKNKGGMQQGQPKMGMDPEDKTSIKRGQKPEKGHGPKPEKGHGSEVSPNPTG